MTEGAGADALAAGLAAAGLTADLAGAGAAAFLAAGFAAALAAGAGVAAQHGHSITPRFPSPHGNHALLRCLSLHSVICAALLPWNFFLHSC